MCIHLVSISATNKTFYNWAEESRVEEIRLFADDCVCYREIKGIEDTLKHQKDIDRLGIWVRK